MDNNELELDKINNKIKLKQQEIDEFMEEQKNYGSFDIEKINELKNDLDELNNKLVQIKKWDEWEIKKIETPICKRCGIKMVMRKAESWAYMKWKVFFWCPNYPKCHNIIHLKR